jgi:C-terminal processing protease CtpA/Prc
LLVLQSWSIAKVCADDAPVFELDCVNFAGRMLDKAPVKKKATPALAADGTAWSISPESKKMLITKVFAGEAAEKAGIAAGDEIVSVNGYPVSGMSLRKLYCAYHMYEFNSQTETLIIQKKDGNQQTVKLTLLAMDKCNPEEKQAWLEVYKGLGY